jgi:Na+/H+ antiporter NhaC
VATLVGGLIYTGEGENLPAIVGSADAFKALMWASFAGALTAGVMSVAQGLFSLEETVQAWYSGVQTMLYAMIILLLAWSLSTVTQELHTADFLVSVIGDELTPSLLPAVVFVFAALVAFATGSSFSTMGIMIPLVMPLVWGLLSANGQANPDNYFIVYSSVASVMAGAVWGDHCSPISDTTILSSMSSDCDLIEHVRTQLPYALSVSVVAIVFCIIPSGFGLPAWLCLLFSIGILWGLLLVLGQATDNEEIQRS